MIFSKKHQKLKVQYLLVFLCVAAILMGAGWMGKGRTKEEDQILVNSIKFRELLTLIHHDYIDHTDTDSLADAALESLIEQLDPHSVYIPRKEVFAGNMQLESNFEGIGAEFQFIEDTIWVSGIMENSPSQKGGLLAGDRILSVNKVPVSGVQISHQELTQLVRGPKGTPVALQVMRNGFSAPLAIPLVRDRIASKSIDFVDMPEPGVGLIKCSRFTQHTIVELRTALTDLLSQGMKSLILDLRDNAGGYVSAAVKVADEFLPEKQLIVYTEGRNPEHNTRTYATSTGLFESGNLLVLINENTASSAEIVTGALQDNDRALVLGRRSFGKGLVQSPITLTDGSEVRLTISRYFTPSGRCIQKGFQRKKRQAYFKDMDMRSTNGELFNKDSIRLAGKPVFKTRLGRKVLGGGGIIPDLFVPKDSIYQADWVSKVVEKPVMYAFILKYFNQHREEMDKIGFSSYISAFRLSGADLNQLYKHLHDFGAEISKDEFQKYAPKFSVYVKAGLAKCLWQYPGFYKVINQQDSEMRKALALAPKSKRTLDQFSALKKSDQNPKD